MESTFSLVQRSYPRMIHLYYRDLLAHKSNILPRFVIIDKLQTLGIFQDTQIVAYCTAWVRARWVTSMLTNLGFKVKNYAGSMLDWSAVSAIAYPRKIVD